VRSIFYWVYKYTIQIVNGSSFDFRLPHARTPHAARHATHARFICFDFFNWSIILTNVGVTGAGRACQLRVIVECVTILPLIT
jgi:hypothetical protein